jgi:hypothetical protein
MNPKVIDLYGALIADGTMTFAEAVDRLMRKQAAAGAAPDLVKAEGKTMTALVTSITRTEKRDAARTTAHHQATDFWLATMAAGVQQGQTAKAVEQEKAEDKPQMRQRL